MIYSFIESLNPDILEKIRSDERLLKAVNAIENENFHGYYKEKLKEYLTKLSISWTEDYIDRGILALQQYYAVAILDWRNMHAVSEELDPFWHLHMLFSADYRKFCDDVYGEYMDHDPLHGNDMEKAKDIKVFYDHTLDANAILFKNTDAEFYPREATVDEMICFHFNDKRENSFDITMIPLREDLAEVYGKYSNRLRLKVA